MKKLVARHPLASIVVAAVAGALVILLIWTSVTFVSDRPIGAPPGEPAGPAPSVITETPGANASPQPRTPRDQGSSDDCEIGGGTVSSSDELTEALAAAEPGAFISLAPGTYTGNFVASNSGTKDAPITVCGTADSVLDGDDDENGYVFHLDSADYWHLVGFTVTNGQKGVMADGTMGSVIRNMTVTQIGDEAIHLRGTSTDNIVRDNTISDTGLRKEKFGEGIYIGTAESNWCDISNCKPDASDRNLIEGNTISGTTSESIDLKEGSSDGVVRNNTFDGSSIVGADSWMDVKGNGYVIEANTGRNSPMDGFQTHEILDGWGTDNVFRNNVAEVNGPGFGYSLTPERDNVVECSNTASGAKGGDMNVTCSR
jgi:parallel beta-helix repeat protein